MLLFLFFILTVLLLISSLAVSLSPPECKPTGEKVPVNPEVLLEYLPPLPFFWTSALVGLLSFFFHLVTRHFNSSLEFPQSSGSPSFDFSPSFRALPKDIYPLFDSLKIFVLPALL